MRGIHLIVAAAFLVVSSLGANAQASQDAFLHRVHAFQEMLAGEDIDPGLARAFPEGPEVWEEFLKSVFESVHDRATARVALERLGLTGEMVSQFKVPPQVVQALELRVMELAPKVKEASAATLKGMLTEWITQARAELGGRNIQPQDIYDWVARCRTQPDSPDVESFLALANGLSALEDLTPAGHRQFVLNLIAENDSVATHAQVADGLQKAMDVEKDEAGAAVDVAVIMDAARITGLPFGTMASAFFTYLAKPNIGPTKSHDARRHMHTLVDTWCRNRSCKPIVWKAEADTRRHLGLDSDPFKMDPVDAFKDHTVSGLSLSGTGFLYYTIEVPAGVPSLTVSLSGGSYDADLYLKYDGKPTESSKDFKRDGSTNNETITLENPRAGTLYIGVHPGKRANDPWQKFTGVTLRVSKLPGELVPLR